MMMMIDADNNMTAGICGRSLWVTSVYKLFADLRHQKLCILLGDEAGWLPLTFALHGGEIECAAYLRSCSLWSVASIDRK